MENEKDPTLEGTPEKTTPEKTAEEKFLELENRYKASTTEAIRLKKENEEFRKSKETAEIPEDERRLRDVLSKIEKEKTEKEKQEKEDLEKELENLQEVYGEFNKEKLVQIVDRYGVYNDDESVNWDKAMELYQKLDTIPTAPVKKIPVPKRESPNPLEVEQIPDVSKKSFDQLVSEGLKKFGLK